MCLTSKQFISAIISKCSQFFFKDSHNPSGHYLEVRCQRSLGRVEGKIVAVLQLIEQISGEANASWLRSYHIRQNLLIIGLLSYLRQSRCRDCSATESTKGQGPSTRGPGDTPHSSHFPQGLSSVVPFTGHCGISGLNPPLPNALDAADACRSAAGRHSPVEQRRIRNSRIQKGGAGHPHLLFQVALRFGSNSPSTS